MRSTVIKVLSIAAAVAGVGYGIWAQEARPPMFPADRLIDLQASWNDGRYGVKMTVLLSLFTLLAIAGLAALPVAAAAKLVSLGRRDPTAPSGLPDLPPGWTVLLQRPRALSYAGAVIGLVAGVIYLRTLVFSPETIEPYGGPGGLLGILLLMGGPLVAIAGEYFAVEVLMGVGTMDGPIERLTVERHGRNTTRRLWLGGKGFSVPVGAFARLKEGQRCAISYAGGTKRLLELRVYGAG